jgi:hypothetical protein
MNKELEAYNETVIRSFCWDRMREICGEHTVGQHKYAMYFSANAGDYPLCVGSAKTKAELHSRRVLAQEFVKGEYDIKLIPANERKVFNFN